MKNFILRRLLQTLPMLLLASFIIFMLFAKTPGDFIDGNVTLTAARAAELKAIYGLDQPLFTRYLHWLGQLLRGDLGFSLQYQIPVSQLLNQYIWNSFLLASVALVFYWGIGLAVGVVSALRPGSWFDHLVSVAVFAAMSFPTFFLCLLLIKWFAVDLHWLPVGGMTNTGSDESGWQYVLQVAALSGYVGGLTDKLIMRVADLVMTIPGLPLLIVAGAMLSELDFSPDSRIYMVVVMLSLLEWPRLARLVRGQCLSLRERDFMLATQVLGLSARRRLFGHLLPNTIPILVVMATMAVANAILSESALSYLGLGVVPPTPSWGNMMDATNSLIDFQRRPWLWMPPGIAIFITVIAINVLGDGLRDAMDPNMKPRLK